ncbi:MAG TPA: phosphoribosyltransferase family protein [Roseiflexaceae bacterium]
MWTQLPSTGRRRRSTFPDDDGYNDRYADRVAAGRLLAERLQVYRGGRALVLALPPGGVIVAGELARALRLPLDVLVARSFNAPLYPAVVAGAISEGGGLCFNRTALRLPGVTPQAIWREACRARRDLITLVASYRHGRALPSLSRRPIILVDDGLCDGLGQLAAIESIRHAHVHRCVVASPGGAPDALDRVARRADELVTLDCMDEERGDAPFHWRQAMGDDETPALLDQCRLRAIAR